MGGSDFVDSLEEEEEEKEECGASSIPFGNATACCCLATTWSREVHGDFTVLPLAFVHGGSWHKAKNDDLKIRMALWLANHEAG